MNTLVGQFRPFSLESSAAEGSGFWKAHRLESLRSVQCPRARDCPAGGEKGTRACSEAGRGGHLANLEWGSNFDLEGHSGAEQVTELRERSERGQLTRRSLLALPTAAAAAFLASPTLAAVTNENRAPSGNFLLRTLGIGDPDIYYPRFFEGIWNCYSTLIAVETPQGNDKIDVQSVEQSKKRLGYTTTYQARFVPFEGYVVCDRLFTTVSLVESIIGKNTVIHGNWDPRQPNRLELVLKGGAKVENTVTKRSAGMFSPYEFESAEFSRQVLDNFSDQDGPPTVKASQNLTRYQWDIAADDVSKIEAIQKVSMYAVPKEGQDFDVFKSSQPITIYKYRITFERPGL